MHASIPYGVRRPVAKHQQALPDLPRGHRNTSQQRRHVLSI